MDSPLKVSRSTFDAQRGRRFGTINPERMRLKFWDWMVRGGQGWLPERVALGRPVEPPRWCYPWGAREHFGVGADGGPIWTFRGRCGETRDELPDGRIVCIGGECEDDSDPDFCIYNDVVVLGPGETFAIYGYPRDVFPPTDFHSSSVFGDRIIVIGNLGYPEDRRYGTTPVYALHLDDYHIERLPSRGSPPGWIRSHRSRLEGDKIHVWSGVVYYEYEDLGRLWCRRNFEEYTYHIPSGNWEPVSGRGLRHFVIGLEEGGAYFYVNKYERPDHPPDEEGDVLAESGGCIYLRHRALIPRGAESFVLVPRPGEGPDWEGRGESVRAIVNSVPVVVEINSGTIDVVVVGGMDEAAASMIAEELLRRIEAGSGRRCVLGMHPTPGLSRDRSE